MALPSHGEIRSSNHKHGINVGLFSIKRTPFCDTLVALVTDQDLRAYKSKKDIRTSASRSNTGTCRVIVEEVFDKEPGVVNYTDAIFSDIPGRVHQGPALAHARIPVSKGPAWSFLAEPPLVLTEGIFKVFEEAHTIWGALEARHSVLYISTSEYANQNHPRPSSGVICSLLALKMLLSRGRELDSVVDIAHAIWLHILNYHSQTFQNQVSPRLEVTGSLHITCVCIFEVQL